MAGIRAFWRVRWLLLHTQTLLKSKKPEEAKLLCQEAVTLAPRSVQAWLQLSWACFDLNQNAEALEACEQALTIDPRNDWAWKNKGIALVRHKRYEEALEALAKVAPNADVALSARQTRALALGGLKRFDAMRNEAERLVKDFARNEYHWYLLGKALIGLKLYDEALDAYATATRLNPQYVQAEVEQAYVLHLLGRHEEVLEICDRLLITDPQNKWLLRMKGLCLTWERRITEALALYDHLLTLPSCTARDHATKGWALYRGGRYADAVKVFIHALTLDPNEPDIIYSLGCVYVRLQDYEQALNLQDRVRALNHDYFSAWVNTGEILICLNRLDEAHSYLTRAAELKQTCALRLQHAYLETWLGVLHTRKGRYDEALAAFKDAMDINAKNAEAHMGFAELLLALGELTKATSTIERSLALDPYDARAWSLKAQILQASGDESAASLAEAHGQRILAEQRALLAQQPRSSD